MDVPDAIEEHLGDERATTCVHAGGDDRVYVTPTRTLLYRSGGWLSSASVEEFPHATECFDISTGRRQATFAFADGGRTEGFTVPEERVETLFGPVFAGMLRAAGVVAPDESLVETYREGDRTVVVTDARVLARTGEALWKHDGYDDHHLAPVTDVRVESGAVRIDTGGRSRRIETPGRTREIARTIESVVADDRRTGRSADRPQPGGVDDHRDAEPAGTRRGDAEPAGGERDGAGRAGAERTGGARADDEPPASGATSEAAADGVGGAATDETPSGPTATGGESTRRTVGEPRDATDGAGSATPGSPDASSGRPAADGSASPGSAEDPAVRPKSAESEVVESRPADRDDPEGTANPPEAGGVTPERTARSADEGADVTDMLVGAATNGDPTPTGEPPETGAGSPGEHSRSGDAERAADGREIPGEAAAGDGSRTRAAIAAELDALRADVERQADRLDEQRATIDRLAEQLTDGR
jgi:hypothetical protein